MLPSRSGWPSRSRMPAAGSTAIGSMRLLPSRCNCAKPGIRRPDFFGVSSGFVVLLISGDLLCAKRRRRRS